MTYHRFLSSETKAEVRAAKKAAAKESKAVRLARAREVLKTTEAKFRKPRERDPAYLSWLRRAPCLVCAIVGRSQVLRTDPAHVRRSYPEPGWRPVGGAERPSDFRCLPLCRTDHEDQHMHDHAAWYEQFGIYPPEVCAQLKAAQEAGEDPASAVQQIAVEVIRQHPGRRAIYKDSQ